MFHLTCRLELCIAKGFRRGRQMAAGKTGTIYCASGCIQWCTARQSHAAILDIDRQGFALKAEGSRGELARDYKVC